MMEVVVEGWRDARGGGGLLMEGGVLVVEGC